MYINKPKFWNEKLNIFSFLLYPISIIYRFFFFIRQILTKREKFNIPIICVGNIYLGGTGKTPLSIEICKELTLKQFNPVILRKFYKSHKDEYELIRSKKISLILGKTRKECLFKAVNSDFNIAVLDDGFQDFSIKCDKNIICFNNSQLLGNGFLIPAGPLREDFKSIQRAHIIIINGEKNIEFEKRILNTNRNIKIFYSTYIPTNLDFFKDKKLLAFAGIGEPNNFFDLLKSYKLDLRKKISFPDHFEFNEKDFKKIEEMAMKQKLEIITTEKDYHRLKKITDKDIKYINLELKIEKKNEFFNFLSKK